MTLDSSLTSPNLPTNQGIASDGTYYYGTQNNKLVKWDASWNEITRTNNPIGDAGLTGIVNHYGAVVAVGTKLYVAVEQYTVVNGVDTYGQLYICVHNCSDLSFVAAYEITGTGSIGDASGIGYNAVDGYLYVAAYHDGSKLWKYDLTGNYIGTMSLTGSKIAFQGLTFWNGYMYISSSYPAQVVYRYAMNGAYIGTVYTGAGLAEMEGIAHNGSYLMALGISPGPTYYNNVYFLS